MSIMGYFRDLWDRRPWADDDDDDYSPLYVEDRPSIMAALSNLWDRRPWADDDDDHTDTHVEHGYGPVSPSPSGFFFFQPVPTRDDSTQLDPGHLTGGHGSSHGDATGSRVSAPRSAQPARRSKPAWSDTMLWDGGSAIAVTAAAIAVGASAAASSSCPSPSPSPSSSCDGGGSFGM